MARPKIGLALGGGAAHGMAHIGVLAGLERAGIPIDVVSGTSAGSLIGAFCAAGWSAAQMAAQGERFGWRTISRPARPGRGGLLSFYRLEQFVARLLGDPQFAQLQRPFAAVAADCRTGAPVTLTQGRVARAVHASSAVPGVVAPVRVEGRLLMDGGVADNLPVIAARSLGADYVIASSIFGQRYIRLRASPLRGLAALENAVRWTGGGLLLADCVIEPDLARYSYLTFAHLDALYAAGLRAAEAQADAIRRAVGLGS